jgi:hypothetical protein
MNVHSLHPDLLRGVKSELNYLAPMRERPHTYWSDVCVKWPARTVAAVAEARVLSKNVEAHV